MLLKWAFLAMGHSLYPCPSLLFILHYGLSLREPYSPRLKPTPRCFPVPTACMWLIPSAAAARSTICPRIRTMLPLSRSLFLHGSVIIFLHLFSPRRMSPGSSFTHTLFKSGH